MNGDDRSTKGRTVRPDSAAAGAGSGEATTERATERATGRATGGAAEAARVTGGASRRAQEEAHLEPETAAFFARALGLLAASGVPFLLGGAYAFARYTDIHRHTKDLDIFTMPEDAPRIREVFEREGFTTELTGEHWLAKAYSGNDFVDIIFGSANGVAIVDEAWFEHAPRERAFGVDVRVVPPEELVWSKSFVMERYRYDGADVAHVLERMGSELDWTRLLTRFGVHWRVLLSHLVLFGFIYPASRNVVPEWLMQELLSRLQTERAGAAPSERICDGTLLAPMQYAVDVGERGYRDGRVEPRGALTASVAADWTESLFREAQED